MKADFYYLTRTPLDRALPAIAERVLASGARLAIVADDAEMLGHLDQHLWVYRPDSFLPHGQTGDQPVLLCRADAVPSGYANIAYVDGLWRDPASGTARVFYFFTGDALDQARAAWRALAATDVERRYWKQDEAGRWVEGP